MKLCISKNYGQKQVFEKLALDIKENEVTCILGKSGVGKTTLLHILAGLTDFQGEIQYLPARVGYCFQTPRLIGHLSVKENLLYAGANADEAEAMLKSLGLFAYADKKTALLSGGEKQRVAIARAFLSGGDWLLLDEPFSFLDLAWKTELIKTFATLWKEQKPTVVFVTHDIEEAWAVGHRILVMDGGEVVCDLRPNRAEYPTPFGQASVEKEKLYKAFI